MNRLLEPDEPQPFRIERESGGSPFFLICDHAGRRIPRRLGALGVPDAELERHIAWDIGAAGVAVKLSALLDAFTILQTYSRLVIDCNRPVGSPGSVVALSEHTEIPGNLGLTAQDADLRAQEIFWPYHERIRRELDARAKAHRATVLVSIHSFTPVFKSNTRPMQAGVLYQRDARLAHRMLKVLRQDATLVVGDNEPYSVSDLTDYAIPVYGEQRGLPHVELEIRQDLIAEDPGQTIWAARIAAALEKAAIGLT
jgi:predicted N-formylglutamate amidohydrolase